MPADGEPIKSLLAGLSPAIRRSLGENVLDGLRAAIVRGAFAPGEHLSEAALAATFNVSRGPIREAFAVLEREGLLHLERHRGARVKRLSKHDIDEIYELRTTLERLAVERAVRFATEEDLALLDHAVDALKAAVKSRDVPSTVEADVRFHDSIYRAAHHTRLYASWSDLRPQIETFLHSRSLDDRDYLKRAVPEHTALRDVIRAKSKRAALTMIGEHLRTAYLRLSELADAGKDET